MREAIVATARRLQPDYPNPVDLVAAVARAERPLLIAMLTHPTRGMKRLEPMFADDCCREAVRALLENEPDLSRVN